MADSSAQGPRYKADFVGDARAEFLRLVRLGRYSGQASRIIEAMEDLFEKLKTNPREIGEPLYHLRVMKMEVRAAVQGPLYIEFGIHDEAPIVLIRFVAGLGNSA